MHPDDLPGQLAILRRTVAEKGRGSARISHYSPGRLPALGSGSGHLCPGADGKPDRLVGVNLDITERKQAEELLLRSKPVPGRGRADWAQKLVYDYDVASAAEMVDASPSLLASPRRNSKRSISKPGRNDSSGRPGENNAVFLHQAEESLSAFHGAGFAAR